MTHLSDHNDLADALLAEAARFRTTIDIGSDFELGDPAHVVEHNRLCIAMIHLDEVAQETYDLDPIGLTLPDAAAVGDTGHIADHALLEDALALIQAVELPW